MNVSERLLPPGHEVSLVGSAPFFSSGPVGKWQAISLASAALLNAVQMDVVFQLQPLPRRGRALQAEIATCRKLPLPSRAVRPDGRGTACDEGSGL